jgi:hypothetical protein
MQDECMDLLYVPIKIIALGFSPLVLIPFRILAGRWWCRELLVIAAVLMKSMYSNNLKAEERANLLNLFEFFISTSSRSWISIMTDLG